MRSDLSETGNPSNPRIIQYTFSEDHPNALQQAKSFSRIACMHNPNFKEFLRKLHECENPPTLAQFAELEAIIKREEDFMMLLIEKSPHGAISKELDLSSIESYMNYMKFAATPSSTAFSLKIMREAILALKGGGKLYNDQDIVGKNIQEVRGDIVKRLQEVEKALILSTNSDLPRDGVMIEKREKDSATSMRIFIDKPVAESGSTTEDGATRFAKDIETLGLTAAQQNYLKMSVNQASFAGITADISAHQNFSEMRLRLSEQNVVKIIAGESDVIAGKSDAVFLELSSTSVYLDNNDNPAVTIFYTSRIDLSNIEEEEILIGEKSWTFIKAAPPTTITMVICGAELDQELSAEQGIIAIKQSQEASLKTIHQITENCYTPIFYENDITQQKGAANPIATLKDLQQSLSLKKSEGTEEVAQSNLFYSFLESIILSIKQLIDTIVMKFSSLFDSHDNFQVQSAEDGDIKKVKTLITALEFTDQVMRLSERTDALSQQRAVSARQSDEHHLGSGQHGISGTQERIERQNSRTFVESLEESQKLSDPNAHKTASRSQ